MQIQNAIDRGDAEEALRYLQSARIARFTPDIETGNNILNLLANHNESGALIRFFKLMQSNKFEPNINTYNIIIRFLCQRNDLRNAIKMLAALRRALVTPNDETIRMIITLFRWKKHHQLLAHPHKSLDLKPLIREFCRHLGIQPSQLALLVNEAKAEIETKKAIDDKTSEGKGEGKGERKGEGNTKTGKKKKEKNV